MYLFLLTLWSFGQTLEIIITCRWRVAKENFCSVSTCPMKTPVRTCPQYILLVICNDKMGWAFGYNDLKNRDHLLRYRATVFSRINRSSLAIQNDVNWMVLIEILHSYGDFIINDKVLQYLDLWSALMGFEQRWIFMCHTSCDTGPRFLQSDPNDHQI